MAKQKTETEPKEVEGRKRTRLISPIANQGARPFSKEQQIGKRPQQAPKGGRR